jgi:hypothetical protein
MGSIGVVVLACGAAFVLGFLAAAILAAQQRRRQAAAVPRGPRDARFAGDKHKASVDFSQADWGLVREVAVLCNCRPSDVVRAAVVYAAGAFLADRSLPHRLNTFGREPQK